VTWISCSSIVACSCPLEDDSRHQKPPFPLCAGVRIGGIRRMPFVCFLEALFALAPGAGLPSETDTPVSARAKCCAGDPIDGTISGLGMAASASRSTRITPDATPVRRPTREQGIAQLYAPQTLCYALPMLEDQGDRTLADLSWHKPRFTCWNQGLTMSSFPLERSPPTRHTYFVSLIFWKFCQPSERSFLQKRVHDCDVRSRTRYAPHAGSSCCSPCPSIACVKNAGFNDLVEGSGLGRRVRRTACRLI
jgi:hypothetical protein